MPLTDINGSDSQQGSAAVSSCTCMQGYLVHFSIGTPTVLRFIVFTGSHPAVGLGLPLLDRDHLLPFPFRFIINEGF
jgi:hypothetical protein